MPFFKLDKKIVYFAHIPKCGGTTVEQGLIKAGFDLCFLAGGWRKLGQEAWVRSSPQHITVDHLDRLFGQKFFDYSFAVVRDPIARFISAANYNRQNGNIPWHYSLKRIVFMVENSPNHLLHQCDNHFVPAVDIIPDGCRTFRLEDGFAGVKETLISDLGQRFASIEFDRHNKKVYNEVRSLSPVKRLIKSRFQPDIPKASSLPSSLLERIEQLYDKDMILFQELGSRFITSK